MARSEVGRTGARFGAPASRHTPDPEHPHGPHEEPREVPAPVELEGGIDESGDDLIGVTGARFGGHSSRRRRKSRAERAAARAAAAESARRTAEPEPDTRETAPLPAVVEEPAVAASSSVRPYVLTGGRTRVRMELRLETLISAPPGPASMPPGEKAAVLTLCAQPRSVSEVAALASVPLGVARVLIEDLATEGRLTVHGTSSGEDGPSVALMNRVLAGLRRL